MKKIIVIPGHGVGKEVFSYILPLLDKINIEYTISDVDHLASIESIGLKVAKFKNIFVDSWKSNLFELSPEERREFEIILKKDDIRHFISFIRGLIFKERLPSDLIQEFLFTVSRGISPEFRDNVDKYDSILLGPVETEAGGYFLLWVRAYLDLYINMRPVKSYNDNKNIDMVIVRENSEDLYAGIEGMLNEDVYYAKKVTTKFAVERIAKFAFSMAQERKKNGLSGKVTVVHKANLLGITDGSFLRISKEISKLYEGIELNDIHVDNCAMQLILNPEQFNILLAPNLYGDILSDEASALVGGLGLAPSVQKGDRYSVFGPVHGTAPDIAGKGIANPLATVLSIAMMCDHLGMKKESDLIEMGVRKLIQKGIKTVDLGGKSTTKEVCNGLINAMDDADA